jgi:hypothetical protein
MQILIRWELYWGIVLQRVWVFLFVIPTAPISPDWCFQPPPTFPPYQTLRKVLKKQLGRQPLSCNFPWVSLTMNCFLHHAKHYVSSSRPVCTIMDDAGLGSASPFSMARSLYNPEYSCIPHCSSTPSCVKGVSWRTTKPAICCSEPDRFDYSRDIVNFDIWYDVYTYSRWLSLSGPNGLLPDLLCIGLSFIWGHCCVYINAYPHFIVVNYVLMGYDDCGGRLNWKLSSTLLLQSSSYFTHSTSLLHSVRPFPQPEVPKQSKERYDESFMCVGQVNRLVMLHNLFSFTIFPLGKARLLCLFIHSSMYVSPSLTRLKRGRGKAR